MNDEKEMIKEALDKLKDLTPLEVAIEELLKLYKLEGWLSTKITLIKCIGEERLKEYEDQWSGYSLEEE